MSNVDKFLNDLKDKCAQYNVKLRLSNSYSVNIGMGRSGGYFDYGNLEIAVAKKHKDWLPILVHESCHLDQWIEKPKVWTKTIINDDDVYVYKWLQGKDVKFIKNKLDRTREMELDCERRSITKILNYELPIDTKVYIQKANAYVQFYNYLYESRKWSSPNNSPYSNEVIYSQMPTRFREKSYYKTLPKKIRTLFIEEKI
jgi:hypothetical protein